MKNIINSFICTSRGETALPSISNNNSRNDGSQHISIVYFFLFEKVDAAPQPALNANSSNFPGPGWESELLHEHLSTKMVLVIYQAICVPPTSWNLHMHIQVSIVKLCQKSLGLTRAKTSSWPSQKPACTNYAHLSPRGFRERGNAHPTPSCIVLVLLLKKTMGWAHLPCQAPKQNNGLLADGRASIVWADYVMGSQCYTLFHAVISSEVSIL